MVPLPEEKRSVQRRHRREPENRQSPSAERVPKGSDVALPPGDGAPELKRGPGYPQRMPQVAGARTHPSVPGRGRAEVYPPIVKMQ